jgi:hypothetical protein
MTGILCCRDGSVAGIVVLQGGKGNSVQFEGFGVSAGGSRRTTLYPSEEPVKHVFRTAKMADLFEPQLENGWADPTQTSITRVNWREEAKGTAQVGLRGNVARCARDPDKCYCKGSSEVNLAQRLL